MICDLHCAFLTSATGLLPAKTYSLRSYYIFVMEKKNKKNPGVIGEHSCHFTGLVRRRDGSDFTAALYTLTATAMCVSVYL